MKTFAKELLVQLEKKLHYIHNTYHDPIEFSRRGAKSAIIYIEILKKQLKKHTFLSQKEEIEFFKLIKPQFASKIIIKFII
jgi:hypothetical protein